MSPSGNKLIWIDLEMTGLDATNDRILEIAALVTDNNLTILDPGVSYAIHQPAEILDNMNSWCKKQHGGSGLTEASRRSNIALAEAEQLIMKYLRIWCTPHTAPLCGNSVYQDRAFLKRYMPEIESFLHYRIIDVSSVKEVVRRWYPQNKATHFVKAENHRALEDIIGSVHELQHYRHSFFIK